MKLKADLTCLVVVASVAALGIAGARDAAAMEQGKVEPKITAQATPELKPGQKVPSSNPLSGDPEAIELGKSFGGTDGHKFVNGVLEKLAVELRAEEIARVRQAV